MCEVVFEVGCKKYGTKFCLEKCTVYSRGCATRPYPLNNQKPTGEKL